MFWLIRIDGVRGPRMASCPVASYEEATPYEQVYLFNANQYITRLGALLVFSDYRSRAWRPV